jgi:DNA-binding LacI/PurR family transcriptional regulator
MIIPQNFDKTDSLKKLIRSRTVDGMILFGTSMNDIVIKEVQDEKFPFIVVNNYSLETPFPYVDCDNVLGARLAVDHLYERGKRRIAFIGGAEDSHNALDRKTGYREGLKKNGLSFDPALCFQGAFLQKSGMLAVEYFLALAEKPDAIFAADDIMAYGAIRALKKHGLKVPEDIAVVGFDNSQLAEMIEPPLTTVNHPVMDIGKKAAEVLMDIVDGKKVTGQVVIRPELVVRESS